MHDNMQGDWKVTQPKLKYLLMVAIQYNLIGLIHTTLLWLYKIPCKSRHIVTWLCQSVSCLQTAEVQGCLFHKCNKWSLSNITWHWHWHFSWLVYQLDTITACYMKPSKRKGSLRRNTFLVAVRYVWILLENHRMWQNRESWRKRQSSSS
jgi:hypothetical protein